MYPRTKTLLAPNKTNKHEHLYSFTPAILWGVFVGISTLIPSENIPDTVFNAYDKLVHAGVFAILTFLLFYAFRNHPESGMSAYRRKILVTIFSILYGGIIEILQSNFISGRSGDWIDFLADAIGCILVFLLFDLGGKLHFQKKK